VIESNRRFFPMLASTEFAYIVCLPAPEDIITRCITRRRLSRWLSKRPLSFEPGAFRLARPLWAGADVRSETRDSRAFNLKVRIAA